MNFKDRIRLACRPRPAVGFRTIVVLIAVVGLYQQAIGQVRSVTRIAFGSCIQQDRPVPILDRIIEERPDLVLMTGDNIYADTDDMDVMRKKYESLASVPAFKKLRQSCEVLATWDDHDFGVNDGGSDYPKREEAEKVFLDFWSVEEDDPRRSHPGVYFAKTYASAGRRVQIIMLDTRYFRSPLARGEKRVGGAYVPDPDPKKTMLGPAQWRWLGRKLSEPADLRLIVTSIQFAASDAGQECWANLPSERQRMIELIHNKHANGVIFISGDRHWSEISAIPLDLTYPLYDVTSSSLNQIHPRGTPTENRFRVSGSTYHLPNYGLMEIDWSGEDPQFKISVRDINGDAKIEKAISLSELSF